MLYLLFAGVLMWRRSRSGVIGPAVVLAFPVMFLIGVVASFTVGRIRAKVWGTGPYAASNEGRMVQVRMGLPTIFSHPFGHGIGPSVEVLGFTNPAGVQTIHRYSTVFALH